MEYRRLEPEEFGDISSRILHEDNHVLIFNKAAGEIVRTQAPELPKEAEREFEPIFEDTDIPPEDYWE